MSVPEECFNYKIFGLEQSALRETAFENIFCSTGRRDASRSQGFNLNAPLSFYSVANLSFTGKICGTQQQQVFQQHLCCTHLLFDIGHKICLVTLRKEQDQRGLG